MSQLVANKFIELFESFRMPPTAKDQYEQTGKAILSNRVANIASTGKPIEFYMLGFPFKSKNSRDKVLGVKPDLGEELTLRNFSNFNEEVKKFYPSGVIFNMATDGFMFNDILNVSDSTVEEYKEISMDMGKDSPVRWFDLRDFYSGSSIQSARSKAADQFGITEEHLQKEILFNPDVNFLYLGMIRFMMEELAIENYPSGNQLQKAAKKLTREMMIRTEIYSNLVRHEFDKDKIRLSMHPSVNNGFKYSFKLINSPKANHSCWHSTIVTNGSEIITMHRKDAEKLGYSLVMKDGRPYNFTSN